MTPSTMFPQATSLLNQPLHPGPRPLPLHMALQTLTWMSSLAALSGLKSGSLPWRPELRKAAGALQKSLENAEPAAFATAVDAEAKRRLMAFSKGVLRYGQLPRQARPAEPPVFWSEGTTRVLDYGRGAGKSADGDIPILLVPSLINRGYILDLTEKRSLARYLAGEGFRPFLVDWGAPGEDEREFGLTDYICRRLEPALDEICQVTGRAPVVVGYCMGGLLTLALAVRKPEQVAALVLLATPWDFHAGPAGKIRMLKATAPVLLALIDQLGELPVDVMQAMFTSLDPYSTANKFRRFAELDEKSAKVRHFLALEDWLNDGVPLVGPVARECLMDWYVDNAPAKGAWKIGGETVLPRDVQAPSLVVIPQQDHIVPPGSAIFLAEAIPGATAKILAAGHIGMATGGKARTMLYIPLVQWLDQTLTKIN